MAANLQNRGLANLGKRFVSQIRSRDSPAVIPTVLSLRSVHNSVYDKNHEENVHPTVVPDHIIPPQPAEYWAPHPETGVFGPAKDVGLITKSNVNASGSEDSVLEQTTFFRPLEDLDKPPVQP